MKPRMAFVCVVVWGSLASSLVAAQLTTEYSFDRPRISAVTIDGQRYDRVSMPGCPNGGNAGQPALPAKGARILLPSGAGVSSVEIMPGERVLLGSGYLVEPVGRSVRLSAGPGAAQPPTPDPTIYVSMDPFPGTQFVEVGTHSFRGYQILVLRLQPVQYVPGTGELYYYPHLTVVVNLVDAQRAASLFRGLEVDRREVLAKVDNPEEADTYPAAAGRQARSFNLLILTTPSLAGGFEPLKAYHDANGIPTEIHTTDDVGSTNPDDVRDYVTERYSTDGIEYLIVGGDDDIIPAKDLYVDGINDMPGDLYFGCLDGTWNYDGDSYWGEPTDGEGGGDVDLVAEVYVGRAAVGNSTEVGRFVDKTIWYLTYQHTQPEKVQLVGEYLGFGGPSEYAGDTLDELVDGSDAHGYLTVGFPSEDYEIDKLYERDWPGHSWPQSELISRINDGLHALDHLGHGSPDYAMKLYTSDILDDLTNEDLCFVYSQTCSAGHFDGTDCWAETIHIKTDYGAFGVVMNARYGYGEWESTDGPSQRYNREFWDAVFAEDMPEMGRANQDSKEDNLYRVDEGVMRWCYYELNLFGDPTVAFRGTCSDAGTVTLDRPKYACESTANILVNDCGLNLDDETVEFVTVDIDSDSETGVEQVTLTETDTGSAKFTGSIDLNTTDSAGVLLIAQGDIVTVTYIDADDGQGGTEIVVTDTAIVDCSPPVISDVQTIDIEPRSATVTFDADEPVRGTVHYGLSCASLTDSATGSGYTAPASVDLTGLNDNTTYFYIVEAEDEAGNTVTDDNGGACYTFTTPEVPDFFTEIFESNDNDLDNLSLILVPNDSNDFYFGCVEEITELPTDPAGGTTLSISEDSYEQVMLEGGETVSLYGVSYSDFSVCDNGCITFGAGDTDYTESLEDHFDMPRIAALFDDFSVAGGTVSWKELEDRIAVTYEDVPEYNTSNSNTFQVEMYFDGTIVISYLAMAASDGLAGLSEGQGLDPDFFETDLSEMGPCAALTIELPEGTPWRVDPGVPTTISVQIEDGGETVVPDSETLYYRLDGGTFLTSPLTPLGGNLYEATLPAPDCDSTPEFYFSAAGDGGTTIYEPPDAPATVYSAIVATLTVILDDDFETDQGWTVEDTDLESGSWERGIPAGDGTRGDPVTDFDGSGQCYLTGNGLGNSDVDGGPTRLISPILDLSGANDSLLRYARWFTCDDDLTPDQDFLEIEASDDDGASWTLIESVPHTEGWVERTIHVGDYVSLTSEVRIRFSVTDNPNNSVAEGGVDGLEVLHLACGPGVTGDFDGDGDVDLDDLARFTDCLAGPGATPDPPDPFSVEDCLTAFDFDGDLDVDLDNFAGLQEVFTGSP